VVAERDIGPVATEAVKASAADGTLARAQRHAWWVVPCVIGVLASGSSGVIDPYLLYVATSWVIFGLLGLSLDIVWGKGGILSFGQTALYGIGGYFAGIVAINFAPLTGNTLIWTLPVGALTGAGAAILIGFFVFFSRMGPLQTTIVTYTLTLILWTGAVSFAARIGDAVVGGDNGMSNIPMMTAGFGAGAEPLDPAGMFVTVVLVATAVYLAAAWVLRQPFGLIVACIRQDDVKTELLGYDVRKQRLYLFALGGAVAGIAGALFGGWATYLNPNVFSVQQALLPPIYVLVGGRGSLFGAFIGALAVGGLSFWLGGGVIGGQTTLVLGLALIVLVALAPGGLVGAARTLLAWCGLGAVSATPPITLSFGIPAAAGHAAARAGKKLTMLGMSKAFGGVQAVDDVTIEVASGSVRCLIGPNGAGKSTLLRLCVGLERPDSGSVRLGEDEITRWPPYARVQAGLGIKTQRTQVFHELSVWANLWIAAYARENDAGAAVRAAARALDQVGLRARAHEPASALAHGEQQWLDIGMVLCPASEVILLDEPTAGMTASETRRTAALIQALAGYAAVVVIDHDMEFVRMLDAPTTVLHQGAVFAEGNIAELRRDERVLDIYLGRRGGVENL
jgi:branched-chain amino acid transport system permease protein